VCFSKREKNIGHNAITLKRAPIEENLDDFEDSSGGGGNRDETKAHGEAFNRA